MDYNWRQVDPSRIVIEDKTFKICETVSVEALVSSIGRIGLINPPVLWPHEDQFIIVCGFSRVKACRQLGWTRMPARCLDPPIPRSQCALIAVAEAVYQRPLHIIEQARALDLLKGSFGTHEEAHEAARAVGLAINPGLTEKLMKVTAFGRELQQAMIDGTIGLPVALRIFEMFEPGDAEEISLFFRQLRLSLTRQREVLDWIEAIVRRDGITLHRLLADPQIQKWRNDAQLEDPQRSQLIRGYLKRRCYPAITAFEAHYAQALKKVAMGEGIGFRPPAHFEGHSFSLQIDFSSHDECVQRIAAVQQLVRSSAFRELVEPQFKPDHQIS